MATTITLAGHRSAGARRFLSSLRLRPQLGDAWTDDAAAAAAAGGTSGFDSAVGTFAKSAAGWGVLTFAVWTAGLRLVEAWRKA